MFSRAKEREERQDVERYKKDDLNIEKAKR